MPDTEEAHLKSSNKRACDVMVVAGGVSMVRRTWLSLSCENSVPSWISEGCGKARQTLYVWRLGTTLVFGLPGFGVCNFFAFVRPALWSVVDPR